MNGVTDNDQYTESRLVLVDMTSLAMQSKIPKSYNELAVLLWQAFHLGKRYRDEGGKE